MGARTMSPRVKSLFDELAGTVRTPTITLYPDKEYRSQLTLGSTEGPLDLLLKRLTSTLAPEELQEVRLHATGRPVIVSSEGGSVQAVSSSGFSQYPVAAAAFAPLDELIAASSVEHPMAVSPCGGRGQRPDGQGPEIRDVIMYPTSEQHWERFP